MPDFNIAIKGDVAPVVKSIGSLKAELQTLQESLKLTSSTREATSLKQEIASVKTEIKAAKDAGPLVREGSIEEARLSVKRLKAEIASLNREQLSSSEGIFLTNELKTARAELISLEKQANITSKITGNSFKDAIAPEKEFSNQIRQIGRIIPGLGIAGLFSIATTGIGLLISSITELSSSEKKAQEQAEAFKKEFKEIDLLASEASGSEQGNIAKVNSLAKAVSDSNIPYAERKRALQELREVNKNYFGDLTKEDILTGKLAATVNEYTKAIINSAIQKEYVSEIAKVAKAIADNDAAIVKSKKAVLTAQQKADEAAKSRAVDVTGENMLVTENLLAKEVTKSQEDLNEKNLESTRLKAQELALTDTLNKAVLEGLKYKDLDNKTNKKAEDALKIRLEQLQRLKALTKDATSLREIQEAIFEVQIKLVNRDQKKNHITDEEKKKLIQGYQDELNTSFKNEALSLEAIPKVRFSAPVFAEIPNKSISDVIAKATGLEKDKTTDLDYLIRIYGKKKGTYIYNKQQIQKDLGNEINGLFENLKLDAVTTLGETIGNALSGNGDALKNGLKSIIGILGNVMVQFGKYVITAALKIEALKKIVTQFAIKNPLIAVAGGIALIAAGTALKNVNVDVPKFAQGGIVTGPTIGLIGEAGKEAVIPLAKLPGLIQNSNSSPINITIGTRISDRELSAFVERANKKYNRLK